MFKNKLMGLLSLALVFSVNVSADDYGNSTSAAANIAVDSSLNGKISFGGDNDYFKFTLPTSGSLTLWTSGSTDTYGYLLNANGDSIASNDDSGAGKNFRISMNVKAGTYYIRLRGYSWFTSGSYSLTTAFVPDVDPAQKIVLLLHGLSSNADTWQDLVDRVYGGVCPTISSDVAIAASEHTSTAKCYRVNFGQEDKNGLSGLEDQVCTQDLGCAGDFSSFEDLGREVKANVAQLMNVYPDGAKIILVGHSRGGLAARAFLQEPTSSVEKDSIEGLITTGTPHTGSPLGRFYKFMKENCYPRSEFANDGGECEQDWQVVDMFLGKIWYIDLFVDEALLDLTTPSINFLSPESQETIALGNGAYMLDGLNVRYKQMVYSGYDLGDIVNGYNLFTWSIGEHLESGAESAILEGYSETYYDGDSIVPTRNQRFSKPEFSATGARHTDETGRVTDLVNQIDEMSLNLGWKN